MSSELVASLPATVPHPSLSREQQHEIYHYLKLTRLLEERLVNLYRQTKVVGGLYRSLGQEATAVGSAYALDKSHNDMIAPLIRDLGAMLVMGATPRELLLQYMAKRDSPTRGRDLQIHYADLQRGFIGPISHLGDMLPVMCGIALGSRLRRESRVCLVYMGDGASSTGTFAEGMNFAAVQRLPVVVIVENNGYAYSTPTSRQMAVGHIVDKAVGFGVRGERVDGNDVLAVYDVTRRAVEHARAGGGVTLIEAVTFRMKGHAEHDDQRYVPKELLETWAARDPLQRYERHLLETGLATPDELEAITQRISRQLDDDVAFAEANPMPEPASALLDVYAS
ncbi:thiamine pyrophosphate-dependent dehydrogenase E1 component subunit alpha [Chloracidobacterium sp. MS 40/45]|uniref:thiamine pyrophosphate-dependent dehydrogenase E1 component subunit alpha n=1 Tax=Chloracidobacterium aggregatum TaxID=2851959 RepID=UPI001B8CE76F|nr:thiamine pyrophosphate-dependent dehydrogenase E1 component subunit alpha [Chloracidobacterium aggregatum]QUV99183.1 thiamine pyrophosphate-dependent dehydrogenase E1 component subunit alpha [Chloracidobacterium sp. MS 40/45]